MATLIPENIRSRDDVKHAIRKVASFLANLPPNAVVWYEPLFDPAGEKPDFIVWLPARGIVVLEVLDARVENIIGVKRNRIQVIHDGEDCSLENPIQRAAKLADILQRSLGQNKFLENSNVPISSGACLPHLSLKEAEQRNLLRHFDRDFTLFRDDLEDDRESALLECFSRFISVSCDVPFSEELDKNVRGVIQPELVIRNNSALTLGEIFSAAESEIRVMDRQQEAIAKTLGDGHRVIRGVAGSGKTLILVFRAKLLARCNPRAKYLVVCYTKTLAGQLSKLLSDYPNIDVLHIDKLATDLASKIGKGPRKGPKTFFHKFAPYRQEVYFAAALEAVEREHGTRYDGVLVDEAQDLDTEALILLTKLLKPNCHDLILVADAAQNIFRKKFSWKSAGIQAQGRTKLLKLNYRNTREILDFAHSFLSQSSELSSANQDDEHSVIPPESSKRNGPVPETRFVKYGFEECSVAVDQALEMLKRIKAGQRIAILYPGSDEMVKRGKELQKRLSKINADFLFVNDGESAKLRLSSSNEKIIVSTVQSAKGLEFSHVIVCGIWWEKGDLETNRRLAYVAMTRATEELLVISREGHELERDLRFASGQVAAAVKSHPDQCLFDESALAATIAQLRNVEDEDSNASGGLSETECYEPIGLRSFETGLSFGETNELAGRADAQFEYIAPTFAELWQELEAREILISFNDTQTEKELDSMAAPEFANAEVASSALNESKSENQSTEQFNEIEQSDRGLATYGGGEKSFDTECYFGSPVSIPLASNTTSDEDFAGSQPTDSAVVSDGSDIDSASENWVDDSSQNSKGEECEIEDGNLGNYRETSGYQTEHVEKGFVAVRPATKSWSFPAREKGLLSSSDLSLYKDITAVFGHSGKWLSSNRIFEFLVELYDYQGSPGKLRRVLFNLEKAKRMQQNKGNQLWRPRDTEID